MRFKNIEKFNIEDLLLDEGNYRFKKAANQKACVEKIFSANPHYFKGLMKSIAEDNLGELLLVYCNETENIVMDGNRRLSALKVLSDDEYAPSNSLKNYSQELRNDNEINFSNIQAQISNDKKLILHTVYERHAAAKTGKSRISWNAFAAARFRLDETNDDKDWYATALVLRTEAKHPDISDYLDTKYSHETFRRLTKSAFDRGIISKNIFSERNQKIKTTAQKNILDDAIAKAYKFLFSMKSKEISLSRSGNGYADKNKVDEYLNKFSLSPDNQPLEDAKPVTKENSPEKEDDDNDTGFKNESGGKNSTAADPQSDNTKSSYGVNKSKAIEEKLKKNGFYKLSKLYYSLCVVSLNKHSDLMYAGAWMFFELLAKQAGNVNLKTGGRQNEFAGFFNTRMQSLNFQKQIKKECFSTLKEIQEYGNIAKHSIEKTRVTAVQLRNDFDVLEPLIIAILDHILLKKKAI